MQLYKRTIITIIIIIIIIIYLLSKKPSQDRYTNKMRLTLQAQ